MTEKLETELEEENDGMLAAIGTSVFVLTSETYKMDDAPFDENLIVGVFATRADAEAYKEGANPPVTDGKIVEWSVEGEGFEPTSGKMSPKYGVAQ
jgi:hypothetical protein